MHRQAVFQPASNGPSDPSFECFEKDAVSHSEVLNELWEPQRDARVRSQRSWHVVIALHRARASDLLLAPPDLIDGECAAAFEEGPGGL